MRVYALYDESLNTQKALAYIFYYQKSDDWYIEISDDVNSAWELPIILDHFFEQGYKTVDEYWSRKFVEQRIVPPDRQNLGAILKNCNLDTYDEFALFEIADGRCAQDDCYIEKIKVDEVPDSIMERRGKRIETVIKINDFNTLLVTLKDKTVATVEIEKMRGYDRMTKIALAYYNSLLNISVGCHGTELSIQGGHYVSYEVVNKCMAKLPITADMLRSYAESEIISTGEAMRLLNCSRQNLDDLVKRGRLTPAKIEANSRMFFKSDVVELCLF